MTDLQKQVVDYTLRVRQLEESMLTCDAFKGDKRPFKSATLTTAYNQLVEARMMCGDILRLLGVEHPYNNAYTGELKDEKPKYMDKGGLKTINWNEEVYANVPTDKTHDNESLCLAYMKRALGQAKDRTGLFYEWINSLHNKIMNHTISYNFNDVEMQVYINTMLTCIKKANCYLGLRFGEKVKK